MPSYYNLPPGNKGAEELTDFERLLRTLPLEVSIEALDLLETITRNIVQNPSEEKYRRLRTTNEKLSTLFGAAGAMDIMLSMGWQVDGEFVVLPKEVKLSFPQHIVKFLEAKNFYDKRRAIKKGAAKLGRGGADPALLHQLEMDRKERASGPGQTTQPSPPSQGYPAVAQPSAKETPEVVASIADTPKVVADASEVAVPTPEVLPTAAAAASVPEAAPEPKPQVSMPTPAAAPLQKKAEPAKEMSLQELRALQKSKFQDFKDNPDAAQTDAYKRPPSSAAAQEPGWFDWMWGGSSSSSGGGGNDNNRKPPPGGPRIKGVGDLPKPVQRGG